MHEEDRKYQQALIYFNRAIELDPADYRTYTYKGLIYRRLSRDEDALKSYDEAIEKILQIQNHISIKVHVLESWEDMKNL